MGLDVVIYSLNRSKLADACTDSSSNLNERSSVGQPEFLSHRPNNQGLVNYHECGCALVNYIIYLAHLLERRANIHVSSYPTMR